MGLLVLRSSVEEMEEVEEEVAAPVATPEPVPAASTPAAVVPTTLATVTKPAATQEASSAVAMWGQCGGQGYTGSTTCVDGATCTFANDWYSQCL